ncbi:hypothetical protein I3842_08G076100 [Carya illinoinensis]|uniref:Uncharacterized protein n=1 Tax=Carya illinoinensis TaxID=32201 RepID=A0A922JAG7_CARIL|nr:hypothetical protein I3842_08G076100 [Carya illinoinensis]
MVCTAQLSILVTTKALQVAFLPSKDQLADILTKLLVSTRFHLLQTSFTVVDTPLGSRGHIEPAALLPKLKNTPASSSDDINSATSPNGITTSAKDDNCFSTSAAPSESFRIT